MYKEVNIQEQGLLQGSTRAEVGAILSKYCDNCNCHHHRHHGDHDHDHHDRHLFDDNDYMNDFSTGNSYPASKISGFIDDNKV